MPYAAKATVEHEFVTDHLEIYVTFRHSMKLSSEPLTTPPVWDIMPPLNKWLLDADTVDVDIVSSVWLDLWTLLLTSDTIATRPTLVNLEYDGPDIGLRTSWDKQWEPFGPIPSTDLTATLWKTGMIVLWSGSQADIPSGWVLCDGTNGTRDLRSRFIVGAGAAYVVGQYGGATSHQHGFSFGFGGSLNPGNTLIDSTPAGSIATSFSGGGGGTTATVDGRPPFYALCYIMKL
jgi:hypothetical protein